ncbi:MAG: alpha amylase C-terminal domain-containing protein [Gammaproteobacteria bacterium]
MYGGSNVGNQGRVQTRNAAANNRPCSLNLILPPLATLYLKLDQ